MASEFSREFFSANRIVKADLHCARQPREQDLDKIKAELKSLYDATEVLLDVSVDESLLSGYVLQVGDRVNVVGTETAVSNVEKVLGLSLIHI